MDKTMMKQARMWLLAVLLMATPLAIHAQNATAARQLLDKAAAIVGQRGGAQAHFQISSGKYGNVSGNIYIKGTKFHATTPQATVWYNGKTQWSFMKKTGEVNVSNPSDAQRMQMNPYSFINMYKKGYSLSMKDKGTSYEVHLTAQGKKSIPQMYIIVDKKTHIPGIIKVLQGGVWSSIIVSGFKAKKLSDSLFNFNAKDFPNAEIIDLR